MPQMGRPAGGIANSDQVSRVPRGPGVTEQSTWTLISVGGGGGTPKVWHQHGEGTAPVPLRVESVGSMAAPAFVGRAYVCPDCDEVSVVSLPDA
jgi:hypothetical protein